MKRRNFIKLSAGAGALALFPFEAKSVMSRLGAVSNCDFDNRKLVLLNLDGGNDGFNTLIPIAQYDIYSNLRPTVKVPDSGSLSYIPLDTTVSDDQLIGLNPAMSEFKALYDQGFLRVIQGVGYPNQNKSHFASTDLYLTGNDGNSLDNGATTGWIGRFMERHYDDLVNENYPLALQMGSVSASLGFHGIEHRGMSLNITNQDPSGFYSVLNGLAGEAPTNIPNSDFGIEMDYIIETDRLANIYAETVSASFNAGSNAETYPDTDLADQLKTVARMIKGGIETKVFMVRIGGFDTHNEQVETDGSVLGKHHTLLETVSQAVDAFMKDIESLGIADQVVGVTYSEFGRKARENGNLGTDHGEVAPMFIFGKTVKGGISGVVPDMDEATENNNYQVESVQYDYRTVFANALQSFMGAGDEIIDDTFYDHSMDRTFSESMDEDFIREEYVINSECRTNSVVEDPDRELAWSIFPNPCTDYFNVRCDEDGQNALIRVFDGNGRLAIEERLSLNGGIARVDVSALPAGAYSVYCNSEEAGKATLNLIKQ